MSIEMDDAKQPRSIIAQPLDPVEDFRLKMGTINYNYQFDHFFMASEEFIQLVDEFNIWLRDVATQKLPADTRIGNYKIPPELNRQIRTELRQIWSGGDEQRGIRPTYLYQMRNKNQVILKQRVVFKMPAKLTAYESIWQFPALTHLNPKSKTKDSTDLRILLQEPVPFDLAWEGYDVDQLADVLKFKKDLGDHEEAFFESDEEVMTTNAVTMEVSREFFHKVIRILILEFNPRRHEIFYQMKKILGSYKYVKSVQNAMREMGDESNYVVE